MHAWREPLLLRDALEKIGQPLALLRVEGGAKRILVLPSDGGDLRERASPLLGEDEGVGASVVGSERTLDQPALLEIVDQGDQAAGDDAEASGELPLAQARLDGDVAQEARVLGLQPERLQPLGEAGGRMRTDLREKEGHGTAAGLHRRTLLPRIVLVMNHSSTESGHPGPPLALVAAVSAALFASSLAVVALSTGGGHVPSPFSEPGEALRFFASAPTAMRWSAFLQLGAAVPLAVFSASAASRLGFLGIRAAGKTIALAGGLLASAFLMTSAAAQWALAGLDRFEALPVRALHLFAFATGGPAHVATLGLLLAGIAIAAGVARLLPRWMMWSGVALAAVAELSVLCLVAPGAAVLLPIARFPGLAWLIAVGALLPKRRRTQ
jgi:hypothetical protein